MEEKAKKTRQQPKRGSKGPKRWRVNEIYIYCKDNKEVGTGGQGRTGDVNGGSTGIPAGQEGVVDQK